MIVASRKRKGVVLLAVLVVVVLLALSAYQFGDLTVAEYRAGEFAWRQTQAKAFAASGVHYAAAMLSNPDNLKNLLEGNLYHNPQRFADIVVTTDDKKGSPGRFTLLAAPDPGDNTISVRHGVTDETGKINLNALMQIDSTGKVLQDALLKLPNMTDEIAASIVDWLDADDEPRTGGAESDHYSGLSPPYRAKNGPLESLEELLLVKGVTPQLLFGNDRNRNGLADTGETGTDSTLERGWSAFLTIYSRELLFDSAGQPLINVNGDDLQGVYQKLSAAVGDDIAKYIVLYRQYGSSSSSNTSSGGGGGRSSKKSSQRSTPGNLASLSVDKLNLSKSGKQKLTSLFDIADGQVSIPGKDAKSPATVYTSPLKDLGAAKNLLPLLLEKATTDDKTEVPARINVNTAPAEVLATIPELTEADVQSITSLRPGLTSSEPPSDLFRTPSWLLTEANLKPATLKKIDKYVTTRAQVFHVQVVGLLDGPGPSARLEAVIDTNNGAPRFLAWRDLTELGKGWENKPK